MKVRIIPHTLVFLVLVFTDTSILHLILLTIKDEEECFVTLIPGPNDKKLFFVCN
jgi:hypothetical protein